MSFLDMKFPAKLESMRALAVIDRVEEVTDMVVCINKVMKGCI